MKKTLLFFIVAFATFLTPKVFAQTTITFESATLGITASNTYTESGYTFEDPVATKKLEIRGTSNSYPSKVIINKDFNSTIRLRKSDNGIFNLASLAYAGDPWGALADATITGFISGGTTVTSTISSSTRTLSTRTLNWTNLTKVEINYSGGTNTNYGALDNIVVSTGAIIDTQKPSAPTALTTSAVTATSLTLAWTASTDNIGVTSYEVFNGATSLGTTTTTSKAISGLTCNTTYSLTVRAKDAAGNISETSAAISPLTSPCPVPTYTLVVNTTNGSVTKSPDKTSYTSGEVVTLTATANSGYQFSSWSGDATGTSASVSVTMNSNKTVTANFSQIPPTTYALTVTNGTGSGTYVSGAVVNISANSAPAGQVFDKWTGSTAIANINAASTTITMPAAATTIIATYISAPPQSNTTITFESATLGVTASNTYTESGYTFEDPVTTNKLEIRGTSSGYPSKVIINQNWSSTIRLRKSDNGVFNLASLDYASDPWGGLADATITGFLSGGTTVTSTISSNTRTLATRTLNWTNLTKVEINYLGGTNNSYGALDNIVVSSGGTIDTQEPSAPTALTTSAVTATSLTLAWTASTDDSGVITSYEVFNGTSSLGTTTTTSIAISGLTCNTTYSLTVKAKDAAGNISAASTAISPLTSPCIIDTQEPSAPTDLTTSALTSTSFTLAWTASTDDFGVTSYEVFNGATSLGTTTTNSISLTGLTASTTYAMTVKAKDNSGNVSSSSAALNVTTLDTPVTTRTNNIGMNLGNPGIDYNADKVFADAMRSHRSCEKIASADGSDDAPKDANYWPTTDAKFLVWAGLATNNNSGTYKLSFNGSATVTANGQAVSNMVYNSSTNVSTADVVIADVANAYLSLSFSNTKRTSASATNTGVTNVKLMRPLTAGSTSSYPTTSLFMDQFIQQLAPFKCIRSLGWVAANWNQDAVWADRTLMQHARQSPPTGGKAYGWEGRGSSYESLILFANQAQKDVWLNIPHQVDDDYITKLAQLFKYGSDGVTPYTSTQANPVYPPLNSNLKLYVEYSNEIWNDQFSQTGWTYTKASTNTEVKFDGVTDQYELGMRYKGLRTVQISILFRNVFGSDMMTKVRPVVCTQKGYNSRTTQTMSFIDRYYAKRDYRSTWNDPHPVNYYIYGFGGSFYWYTNGSAVTTSTIWTNGSWNATASYNDTWGNPAGFYDQTAWDCGIAKQYGLAYLLYEGDMHPSYLNGDDVVVKQLHTGTWDSRMNQNTLDHLNVLNQVDAELYNFLQLNGFDGSTWAVRNVANPSNSPQMDAINTFNAASPLPITLGSVAPFTRAGNAFDSRSSENRNPNGTGSTTLTAITSTWGTSLSSSYLFRVNSTGNYNVQVQYSTTAAATLAVEFAGNVVATYNLSNTGGAATLTGFANISCSTDKLYSIRLVCTSGVVNIISMSVGINSSANRVALKTETPSDSITNSVVLYPNPATDYITVELPNISENDNANITLSDLTGKVVYKNTVSKVNSLQIQTSNLTKGMYIINVTTGTKNYYKKLIIE